MKQRLTVFRSKSGGRLSRWYPVDGETPDLVEADGVTYHRERTPNVPGGGHRMKHDNGPVISNTSPRWHGRGTKDGEFYRHYTKTGKPVVEGGQLREAQARAAYTGEKIFRARDV